MKPSVFAAFVIALAAVTLFAQTPRPFPTPPKAGSTAPVPQQPPVQSRPQETARGAVPTEATLGVPIYPSAQFVTSYDAGLGQRYYLFGTQASFIEVVTYYKTILKQKGEVVFDQPPTHMFEVGKFREETMAFPPGVTVKDFSMGGSEGYLNPKPGGTPRVFATIVQVVPLPSGAAR
jgi:hypothetical protein